MVFLWTPRDTLHLSKISSALGTRMKALSLGTTSSISGSLLFSLTCATIVCLHCFLIYSPPSSSAFTAGKFSCIYCTLV